MSGTGVSTIRIRLYLINVYSMFTSLIMNAQLFLLKEDFSKLNTLRKLLKIQGKFIFLKDNSSILI